MKKKYEAIKVPVCMCGRDPEVYDLMKLAKVYNKYQGRRFHYLRFKMVWHARSRWVVRCRHCSINCFRPTKREAVQAFCREVEVDV